MSPKRAHPANSVIHTGVVMDIIMNDEHIVSIAQLQEFLKAVDGAVTFNSEAKGNKNKQRGMEWIGQTLGKFRYGRLKKKRKNCSQYLKQTTKLSKNHLKKLIARKERKKTLRIITGNRHVFSERYGTSNIARLIETDNAHGRISGVATKRILEREFLIFGRMNTNESLISRSLTSTAFARKRDSISQLFFLWKRQKRRTGTSRSGRSLIPMESLDF